MDGTADGFSIIFVNLTGVKAVDFNSGEIKDLKEKNKEMAAEIQLLKSTNVDQTEKLSRVER